MNKELKYNGHTASPADYSCPDGDLTVAMDLWPENGALKPVLDPMDKLQLEAGQKVLFVHDTSAFVHKHYIVYDSVHNTLFWVEDGSTVEHGISTTGLVANSIVQITGIGNTLVLLTTSGMRYYLWQSPNYTFLGDEIPEIQLSFGLQGEMKRYPEDGSTFHIEFDSIAEGDIFKEFTDENKQRISDQVLGKVNKFIADQSTNVGKFIYPFLARYALRLYDGSLIRHSSPILMICSSDLAPQVFYTHITGRRSYTDADLRIVGMCHKLDWAVEDASQIAQLRLWGDIVKSVDIFVSKPIYTYDQNGQCKQFIQVDDSASDCFTICKHTNQAASQYTFPLRYQYNRFGKLYAFTYEPQSLTYPVGRLVLPKKSAEAVKEEIRDTSSFFLLEKIALEDLTTTRTACDVKEDYLQSLVNRESMDDDYDSHDKLIPGYAFPYNSRLNVADLRKRLFSGYGSLAMFPFSNGYVANFSDVSPTYLDNQKFIYTCYVYIKQDGKEIIVKNTPNVQGFGYYAKPYYFYYPNSNAYKVVIICDNTYYGERTRYEFNLEPHNFLNGAFYFGGWDVPSTYGYGVPTPSSDEGRTINIFSKIYTSEVNNPFKWPVTGINTVGTGRVIAISTAAKALSQGQFGQFPLYAFTDDGIWALEVSSTTGGFSSKQPITRDVCLSADSVTQIDNAVLFVTDRGIMLIAGSETQCITEAIDNKNDTVFALSQLPQAAAVLFGQGNTDPAFDFVPFRTFLSGAHMMYDYVSRRIIVFNPAYGYAYIYSMEQKLWAMMRSNITGSVMSYPDCLAMTGDDKLVDFSQRVVNANPSNQVVITRPLKLDLPDILKTVDNIIQRGNFIRGHVQTLLYGSRDLVNWFPVFSSTDHYLRGFRGTPYKYFRIVLKCAMTDNEALTGCSIEFTSRQTNQPR